MSRRRAPVVRAPLFTLVLAIALALALGLGAGSAGALPGPPPIPTQFSVTVDGQTRTVPVQLNEAQTGWTLGEESVVLQFPAEEGEDTDVVELTGSETFGFFDPVLNLGVAVTDVGGASTFGFSITSALVPTLFGIVSWDTQLLGTFGDGASDGGTIMPVAPATEVMTARLGLATVDTLGTADTFGTPVDFYGPFLGSGTFDCGLVGCSTFSIDLDFKGSGGNDTYTLNGRFEVVPEPGTAFLAGGGLALLAALRRRGSRA